MHTYHHEVASVLIARIFLGVLFFLQGYDAIFKIKLRGVYDTVEGPLRAKGIPEFIIRFGVFFTSYIELVCGLFLVFGFLKYYSLYLLGIDLIAVSIIFGLIKPMWDMQHVFPRLVLLLFLLIAPSNWDVFSIDYLWSFIRFVNGL